MQKLKQSLLKLNLQHFGNKMKFTDLKEAKNNFATVSQDPEATGEEKTQALADYMEAVQKDAENRILEEAQTFASDNNVLQSRGQNVLTSDERKFFNAVIDEGGFTDDDILPKTTQERVFEDVVQDHPLLQAIGVQNLGAVTEFIFSDPELAYAWGPLFGEIDGKLNTAFRKEKIEQLKLTAFIPIAKDMLKLGPAWVERYVRTIIVEAMKIGLEYGYVAGRGPSKNEPIGLLKEVSSEGAVTDKESVGELTFKPGRTTVNELKGVVKKLAEKLDKDGNVSEQPRKVENRIVMVTNPFDTFDVKANATIQNANGAYVTNLPFNPTQTESVFVPQGKVAFFVRGEYIAAVGGAMDVKRYKETLALEDADLYIAKQFATGKPKDNNAAQVYDLNVDISDDEKEDTPS
ncbi:phage major capsid protein [Virgibacillus halophilus]|uniref:Phage major capsid protein n=1 Tax=Tigheibacillus halophilus TaxID=361280 RepID=A0ABU5CBU5_9BACI|nr:phage major capsid protein [Virgibacillus halophilus]